MYFRLSKNAIFGFLLLILAALLLLYRGAPMRLFRASVLPQSAVLRIDPATGSVQFGQDFAVDVKLDTGGEAVGGIQVIVSFSSNLAYVGYDNAGTVFDKEVINPKEGESIKTVKLRFDEGFSGDNGQLIRLLFRAVASGDAVITIDEEESEIIAFNGAEDILGRVEHGLFSVQGGSPHGAAPTNTSAGESPPVTTSGMPSGSADPKLIASSSQVLCLQDGFHMEWQDSLWTRINQQDIVFWDVPFTSWFSSYVSTLVHNGIASGYKDTQGNLTGYFGPANFVTYAEVAKMSLELARADFSHASAPQNSSARNDWSASYIHTAEALGISTYTWYPPVSAAASRGAVIQTVLEAAGIPLQSYDQHPYTDVPANHLHRDAILTATALDIVRGDTDSQGKLLKTFRPDEAVNRAEVAKILSRVSAVLCEEV